MIRVLLYETPGGWAQLEPGRQVDDPSIPPAVALAHGVQRGAAHGPVSGPPTGAVIVERVHVQGVLCERRARWVVVGDPATAAGWAVAP